MPDDSIGELGNTIAALRAELTQAQAERDEARAQQDAVAEVLRVVARPGVELAVVLHAVVAAAHRLCAADYAVLFRKDGDVYRWAAFGHTMASVSDELERNAVIRPGTGTLIGRAVLEGRPVQIEDAWTDPLYEPKEDQRKGGIRTMLGVPLMREGEAIGAMGLARGRVEPFTDRQIALVENFAAQAVIAMENARLLTETREALEQQTATAEVLQVINSSPGDLAPVFEAILDKAHRLCDATRGTLFLFDGETFRAAAMHGYPPREKGTPPRTIRVSEDPRLAALLAGERLIHVPDLTQVDDPIARAVAERGGVRTNLLLPLRREGGLLGVISCNRHEVRPFSDKDIALLENFAQQAVIAMENARLLGELRQRTDEVAELNRGLEARVAEQLAELQRVGSLKRFLPPQVAEMVVSQGDERILESHRREIVVVFADVRNYTTFTETAEPEEVIEFLGAYHAVLGPLITRFEGTLSHFFGDGLMVFFNDPVPCPDPAQRAVNMAVAMRETASELMGAWRRRGHRIGFGVGIAQGYATLGQIGFAERMDYTAIGTVTNLAARLCDAAQDGQILISGRIATAVEGVATLEEIGDLSLKGLSQAVAVFNVAP